MHSQPSLSPALMTCEETDAALLEALEIQTRLVNELRAALVDAEWRPALLTQADRQRLEAFNSWHVHLVQPVELTIERLGTHAMLQYGGIFRVLPLSTLKTPRGTQLMAEILWDAGHPRPDTEQYAEAWSEARPSAVVDLVQEIAQRVANLE